MKNLDLMGVQELDAKEIMETDGESLVVAIGLAASIVGLAWGVGYMTGYVYGKLTK